MRKYRVRRLADSLTRTSGQQVWAEQERIRRVEAERDEWRSKAEALDRANEQLIQRAEHAEAESTETQEINDTMAGILTRTANALKGDPKPLTAHSWHDLPEQAELLTDRADHAQSTLAGLRRVHAETVERLRQAKADRDYWKRLWKEQAEDSLKAATEERRFRLLAEIEALAEEWETDSPVTSPWYVTELRALAERWKANRGRR